MKNTQYSQRQILLAICRVTEYLPPYFTSDTVIAVLRGHGYRIGEAENQELGMDIREVVDNNPATGYRFVHDDYKLAVGDSTTTVAYYALAREES